MNQKIDMKEVCAGCGNVYGRHRSPDEACPKGDSSKVYWYGRTKRFTRVTSAPETLDEAITRAQKWAEANPEAYDLNLAQQREHLAKTPYVPGPRQARMVPGAIPNESAHNPSAMPVLDDELTDQEELEQLKAMDDCGTCSRARNQLANARAEITRLNEYASQENMLKRRAEERENKLRYALRELQDMHGKDVPERAWPEIGWVIAEALAENEKEATA